MSPPYAPPILRLVLLPTAITAVVSGARLWGEVEGNVTTASGGAGELLGITWLIPVVGAWFGDVLARSGSRPRLRPAAAWFLAALAALFATLAWQLSGLDRGDTDAAYHALRSAVAMVAMVAVAGTAFSLMIWTRLALALLTYGVLARLVVAAIAILAKYKGWDTHYTKFGPAGIERGMADTVASVCLSQFGFWVPFTVLAGGLCGSLASLLARRK